MQKLSPRRYAVLLSVLALAAVGCEFDTSYINHSSEGDNDYFEEPLSDGAEDYASALETSNKFVEWFTGGQLDDAYELLDPRLREAVTKEEFDGLSERILGGFGDLVEYKRMQWSFAKFSDLENIVVSTKIVVHEESEAYYSFSFVDDGDYASIFAFRITPKRPGETVSDGAKRAHGRD